MSVQFRNNIKEDFGAIYIDGCFSKMYFDITPS